MPPYCYDYPRPSVTVDVAAFALDGAALKVLLIRRAKPPFEGRWALPGGLIDPDEPAIVSARRELVEETALTVADGLPFEPIGFYDAPDRDPRGRTISLAYATVLPPPLPEPTGGDDAAESAWHDPDPSAVPLAFDHGAILRDALGWLARGIDDGPLAVALLPDPFDRDDARGLFRAAGLPLRHVSKWLGKLVRSELAEPVEGEAHRYRRAGAATG